MHYRKISRPTINSIPIALMLLVGTIASAQTAPIAQHGNQVQCGNAVALSGGKINLTCSGLTAEQQKLLKVKIPGMLEKLLDANAEQFAAIEAQLNALRANTQTHMQLEQRAWLGFQNIKVERTTSVETGDQSMNTKKAILDIKGVHIFLVNSGKTPRTIQNLQGTMFMGKQGQIVDGLNPTTIGSAIGMLALNPPKILIPGQSSELDFGGVRMEGTIGMQPLAIVQVRVDYLDIWQAKHTTKLCFYMNWRMGEVFNYCPDPESNSEE